MKITKIINLLIVALLSLFTLQNALAQTPRFNTIDDLLNKSDSKQAFNLIAKGHKIPDWLFSNNKVLTPIQTASFEGHDNILVAWACKAHECPFEQVVLMYNPNKKVMYGLVLKTDQNKNNIEILDWLNIGSNSESIDGKTILYAAITGSLSNHPDNFKFNSK
jgi:hypothetical protein